MTALDDDPEYEAQLKDILREQLSSWRDNNEGQEELGEIVKGPDEQSEDGVLEDAPTFRMKRALEAADQGSAKDEDDAFVGDIRDDKLLSEDARSISTGDDSPSAQVFAEWGNS